MERRAIGHGSSSYGQACMQCFKAKCRCVARPDSDGCERCLRLKKRCQPSEAVRKRGVQNYQTGAQIAELEGKIDLLTTTLQSVVKATGVSVDLSPPLSESLSAVSMGETNSISINTTHDMGAWPTPSTPTHLGGSSQPFSPPLYDPTPNEADGYLNLFRNRMLPYFPFIYMSPGMTALELRRDRPFLFQAIVAVATPSTQHKVARIEVLKYVWAKFVMVENQSTIDILLSILTYITWSTDPFLERSSNLSRMIMLATSLLNNLQRANPAPPEAHIIATMAPGLGETDWDVSEASVPGFLEQRRAVLACFVLSSIISSYYRRTDAIRWTPQMEEALHVISMNEVCPSDEAFAFQVRLQLVAQKVAQVREQHKADRTDVATLPAPTSLYLGVLQKQLQELKASLSPYLRQMDMLTAYVHYVELCIDEVTRLASSNTPLLATPEIAGHGGGNVPGFERLECLWRCLQAVKLWLDVFYTVSPAAYVGLPFFYWFQLVRCIVILKHLSTFEDPAWDCQVVHNTVDMLRLLKWMAEKTELASKEAGEQSDDDLFQQVSKMLRLSQAWVKAKRKPAVPVAEGPTSNPSADPPLATAGDVMADSSQTVWMDAFESGDQSWFENFLGWSPGTL